MVARSPLAHYETNPQIAVVLLGFIGMGFLYPFSTVTIHADEPRSPLIQVSGKEMAKKVRDRTPPEYPLEAAEKRIEEGMVRLKVIIDVEGKPRQLEVLSDRFTGEVFWRFFLSDWDKW